MAQHRDNYSAFAVEIQVFRGDMVDDLHKYYEDSVKHQNDTTEGTNGGLTARLDKSLNSYKQKAPALTDNPRRDRGFSMLRFVVFDRLD